MIYQYTETDVSCWPQNKSLRCQKKGSAFQKFLITLTFEHISDFQIVHLLTWAQIYNLFFHSGLYVNSNLFHFRLNTDKSFSAVKDFSNWSYLRSITELQKKMNISSVSITSTNTLFCSHYCRFFTAYVVVLPNIKKKTTNNKNKGKVCSFFRHSLTYKPFFCVFPSAEILFQADRWGMNSTIQ